MYYTIINVTTMCNYVYIMLISDNFVFLLSIEFSFKIRLNCQKKTLYFSKLFYFMINGLSYIKFSS